MLALVAGCLAGPLATSTQAVPTPGPPPIEPVQCSTTFPDVTAANPFCADIEWVVVHEIADGYSDGRFHPDAAVSRQAMAAFLYHLVNPGTSAPACTKTPFPDVAVTSPFCGPIAWLAAHKIAGGYLDGRFHPTWGVARDAMAAFLYRLAHPGGTARACTAAPFPDVPASSSLCGAISWLAGQHITGGYPDGGFHPSAVVSREAMAAFLHRFAVATG